MSAQRASDGGDLASKAVLSDWMKNHPCNDAPVWMMSLPWGFEIVEVSLDPPIQIRVSGITLEYRAGYKPQTEGGPTLYYSARVISSRTQGGRK